MVKVKAFILFFILVSLLLLPGYNAFAEDITITTYYPSPLGVYKELRAERMAIGDSYYDASKHGWKPKQDWAGKNINLAVEGNVMIGNPDATISIPSRGLGINTYPQYPIDIVGRTLSKEKARFAAGWAWTHDAFFRKPVVGLQVGNADFTKYFRLAMDLNDLTGTTSFDSTGRVLLQSGRDSKWQINIALGKNILPSSFGGKLVHGMLIFPTVKNDTTPNWKYPYAALALLISGQAILGLSDGVSYAGMVVENGGGDSLRIYTSGNILFQGGGWDSMKLKPPTGKGKDDADLHVYGDVHVDGITYTGDIKKADIAENFLTEKGAEPGDVMAVDVNSDERMVRSCRPYSPLVAGIISGNPGLVIAGKKKKGYKPLALKGRVLCKVTDEGGKIRRGDLLVSSSKPGYAMKADPKKITLPTQIVGIAMQNLSPKKHEGEIMVFVK